jgi:hypothetical protein
MKIKQISYLIGAAVIMTACGPEQNESTELLDENEGMEVIQTELFGEEISEEGAMDVQTFAAQFDGEEAEVKLVGTITEVCQMKGCWMTLELENGETMRVRFKDYGFFVPKDAAGKTAIIEGIAKMEETDVATMKHYAEDAGKSQEEIDAITEAKKALNFEAKGVIIK